ncbi:hypothetical protein BDY21DRAFT_348143 [Lineolata rhizophorae]|uniref:Uncharacterized protein n=1 Tax=Lineolata rhizophorae TaxID=578093 RepID=A0A6A6NX84_9PEZI|nr:hypothetical protein BDY21DRAFT_348143 [Lineolata rhizophorae]
MAGRVSPTASGSWYLPHRGQSQAQPTLRQEQRTFRAQLGPSAESASGSRLEGPFNPHVPFLPEMREVERSGPAQGPVEGMLRQQGQQMQGRSQGHDQEHEQQQQQQPRRQRAPSGAPDRQDLVELLRGRPDSGDVAGTTGLGPSAGTRGEGADEEGGGLGEKESKRRKRRLTKTRAGDEA